MSKTLSQIASRVLRNIQLPEDSSTPSVQALADAKQYANEALSDICSNRVWREYLCLGTYAVPSGTYPTLVSLSSITLDTGFNTSGSGYNAAVEEVIWIREGTKPYTVQDISTLNVLNTSLLTNSNSPIAFTNRGANGIILHGQFSSTTTLSFLCKAKSQDLSDSERWILDPEGASLIAKASGDMIRDHDRDDNRAQIRYQEYSAQVQSLIDKQTVQGANVTRIVPVNPWTGLGTEVVLGTGTTTGFSAIYP